MYDFTMQQMAAKFVPDVFINKHIDAGDLDQL